MQNNDTTNSRTYNSAPIPQKNLKYQRRDTDGFRMRDVATVKVTKQNTAKLIATLAALIVEGIK
jgi:hypothetical protein